MPFLASRTPLFLAPTAQFLLRCLFSRAPTAAIQIIHCLPKDFCSLRSATAPSPLAGDSKSTRECDIFQPSFRSAARTDSNFRNGLLQGFSAANKRAKSSACLVRKFAVLTAPLSVQNGELDSDGSVSCFASLSQSPVKNIFGSEYHCAGEPCPCEAKALENYRGVASCFHCASSPASSVRRRQPDQDSPTHRFV